ncbi:formin-like protein 20 [Vombatus ursinus]|uniref:formin-like protein 20 n=1 Tax=Vombatus ursinus TaxID=29139 RepID=UPI000FFCFFD3|nr:formin-like protein 20 [Vombatus ursinus]
MRAAHADNMQTHTEPDPNKHTRPQDTDPQAHCHSLRHTETLTNTPTHSQTPTLGAPRFPPHFQAPPPPPRCPRDTHRSSRRGTDPAGLGLRQLEYSHLSAELPVPAAEPAPLATAAAAKSGGRRGSSRAPGVPGAPAEASGAGSPRPALLPPASQPGPVPAPPPVPGPPPPRSAPSPAAPPPPRFRAPEAGGASPAEGPRAAEQERRGAAECPLPPGAPGPDKGRGARKGAGLGTEGTYEPLTASPAPHLTLTSGPQPSPSNLAGPGARDPELGGVSCCCPSPPSCPLFPPPFVSSSLPPSSPPSSSLLLPFLGGYPVWTLYFAEEKNAARKHSATYSRSHTTLQRPRQDLNPSLPDCHVCLRHQSKTDLSWTFPEKELYSQAFGACSPHPAAAFPASSPISGPLHRLLPRPLHPHFSFQAVLLQARKSFCI